MPGKVTNTATGVTGPQPPEKSPSPSKGAQAITGATFDSLAEEIEELLLKLKKAPAGATALSKDSGTPSAGTPSGAQSSPATGPVTKV